MYFHYWIKKREIFFGASNGSSSPLTTRSLPTHRNPHLFQTTILDPCFLLPEPCYYPLSLCDCPREGVRLAVPLNNLHILRVHLRVTAPSVEAYEWMEVAPQKAPETVGLSVHWLSRHTVKWKAGRESFINLEPMQGCKCVFAILIIDSEASASVHTPTTH